MRLRNVFSVFAKSLLAIIGVLVLIIAGLEAYMELTSRPPGSPPPGSEGRLKYNLDEIPGSSSSRKAPVDLWFGQRDGRYDTTQLRIDSDYLKIPPHYHGQPAHIMVHWPSLRSIHEESKFREKMGLPKRPNRDLKIIFSETGPGFNGTDKGGTAPVTRCEPMIRDEERGVKYCNENRLDDTPGKRFTNYWPLDETIRTPWYKNPPRFGCEVILDKERQQERQFDACFSEFSYNADTHVSMVFVPETLAIDILTHFPELIEFITLLEVKP